MLVLHGTAEYRSETGNFEIGKRYAFNLFSNEDDFESIKSDVATYMGDLGWNEIDVRTVKKFSSEGDFKSENIREAISYAKENKFSIISYHGAIDEKTNL